MHRSVSRFRLPLACAYTAALLLAAAAADAGATVVTLAATKDTTIYADDVNNSNGGGERLFAGNDAGGGTKRGLIAFDVAGFIPAGSTIDKVELSLYVEQTLPGLSGVSVHRLTADWGEAGSNAPGGEGGGAPAQTGDATWHSRFFNTATWATDGGDFLTPASATTNVGGEGSFYSWSSSLLADDVEAWLDSPASNFGWLLRGNEASDRTAKAFASSENLNAALRPQLVVTYSAPIPEPESWLVMLAGVALTGLWRVRKAVRGAAQARP